MATRTAVPNPKSNVTYLSPRGRFSSTSEGPSNIRPKTPSRTAPPSDPQVIYFERGSAIPRREDLDVLRHQAQRLREHPGSVLIVSGYANRRAGAGPALELAQSRAEVVRMVLLALGVEERQLQSTVGGTYAVNEGTTRKSRARNRRAVLRRATEEVGVGFSSGFLKKIVGVARRRKPAI